MIDNRAGPGISQEHARRIGLEGVPMGENTYNHVPTLGCNHCGGVEVVNPNRTRERAYCRACDHRICDVCDKVRREPGYQHRTIGDLKAAVASGKYVLSPGPISRATLIPIGVFHV
jgi:hypothetical protein